MEEKRNNRDVVGKRTSLKKYTVFEYIGSDDSMRLKWT